MANDWFRSSEWSAAEQIEFERRLARSREHNRSQYLKIKAIALADAGHLEAAETLLQRVIDDYPASLDFALALELLGDLCVRRGDIAGAIDRYRRLLDVRPDLNATSGMAPLKLGEALLALHGLEGVPEIQMLVAHPSLHLAFNSQVVRALTLNARAAEAAGNVELQRSEAERALALIDAPSQLPRHPGIGVPRLTDAEVADLRRLSAPRHEKPRWRTRWRRDSSEKLTPR